MHQQICWVNEWIVSISRSIYVYQLCPLFSQNCDKMNFHAACQMVDHVMVYVGVKGRIITLLMNNF